MQWFLWKLTDNITLFQLHFSLQQLQRFNEALKGLDITKGLLFVP